MKTTKKELPPILIKGYIYKSVKSDEKFEQLLRAISDRDEKATLKLFNSLDVLRN